MTNNKIPQEIARCFYCKKPNYKSMWRKIVNGKSYICHEDCWLRGKK
ncbi:MAG: hypothetical protein M0R17_10945 [Candidatus Omnitrophica bacterium]|jgi:hypothetical protein|nr:hypothetical protein [Candidatus Omnitrophota bacterium]